MKTTPFIDYLQHPAFAEFVKNYSYDDSIIDNLVLDIDLRLEDVKAYSNTDIEIYFDNEVLPLIDKLTTYINQHCKSILTLEFFLNAISWVKSELIDELNRKKNRLSYLSKECNKDVQKEFFVHGMYIFSLDQDDGVKLRSLARKYIDKLIANKDINKRNVETVDLADDFGIALNFMVDRSGMLDILSNYMKSDIVLCCAAVEYSFAGQNWSKGCYNDIGLSEPVLEYLHLDEAAYAPKCLYYLSEVNELNKGATRYVKGSNNWSRSEFVTLFHKATDRIGADRYCNVSDNYYRPMFKHSELRQVLSFLPRRLIGSSHLGDDIVNGSEMSKDILSEEVVFLGNGNEAIFFDGGRGYHRGSIVQTGKRFAVQMIFIAKEDPKYNVISGDYYSLFECLKTIENRLDDLEDLPLFIYCNGRVGKLVEEYRLYKNKEFVGFIDDNKIADSCFTFAEFLNKYKDTEKIICIASHSEEIVDTINKKLTNCNNTQIVHAF